MITGTGQKREPVKLSVLFKNKTSLFHYPSNHLVTNKGAIEREARHVLLIVIMSLDKGSSRLSMRSTITAPQSHYYHVLLQGFFKNHILKAAGLTRILPVVWTLWYGPLTPLTIQRLNFRVYI